MLVSICFCVTMHYVQCHTKQPILRYVFVNVLQVASWLEVSSIGIEVIVCDFLFDAHTQAHSFVSKRVDSIHKLGIIWRQSVCGRHAFKQWPCRIQT